MYPTSISIGKALAIVVSLHRPQPHFLHPRLVFRRLYARSIASSLEGLGVPTERVESDGRRFLNVSSLVHL